MNASDIAQTVLKVGLVLLALYTAGRIMFQGRGRAEHFRMMHIVASFALIVVANAFIMLGLMALSALLLIGLAWLIPSWNPDLITSEGKIAGSNLLVYILLLIFYTAFAHYFLRRRLAPHVRFLRLDDEEYQVFEYFIQWLTIYLVVYQCFFEGFSAVFRWFDPEQGATMQDMFQIALTPTNINLVMQPLLIATWVLVVLERFALKNVSRRRKRRGRTWLRRRMVEDEPDEDATLDEDWDAGNGLEQGPPPESNAQRAATRIARTHDKL